MKRKHIAGAAVVVVGFLCLTAYADDKTNGMTEADWKKFAEIVSTQDESQVMATFAVTKEATCFFGFLAKSGALTATPTNVVKEFFVTPYPPTFVAKHPLKMMAEVTLRDAAAGKQRYFMEKTTTNTPWRLTAGWSLSTNGQKGAGLPLPSESTQTAANKFVSETAKDQK